METLKLVKEFHEVFEHPVLPTPQIPNALRCDLRVSLLSEELEELKEAIKNKDMVEVADALADLQYVLSGAVLEFGLLEKFPGIFKEVHRSNMSKVCKDEGEADMTKSFHETKEGGEPCHYVQRGSFWFVYRTRDMKTMKNFNYSAAKIAKFL